MAAAVITLRDGTKRFRAGNSIMVRPVSLGSWTTIRVGILYQLDTTTTLTSPDVFLGFCAGTANCYGDASATHAVGICSTDNWEYSGGYVSGLTMVPRKKVGAAVTSGASITTDVRGAGNPVGGVVRSLLIAQLVYGSPNYTIALLRRSNLNTNDYDEDHLIDVISAAVMSAVDHTLMAGQTLAVDEGTDGTLNAAQFYMNASTQPIEIDAFAVAKIA